MKKFYACLAILLLITIWGSAHFITSAQNEFSYAQSPQAPSTTFVISQFQPGTTASAVDEFVEIHNVSSTAQDLNGYRLVYRSGDGTNDVGPLAVWSSPTIVQPGQYYLVASTSYSGSATPDVVYPTTSFSISASRGGLAIRQGAQNAGPVIDAVGWGDATNIFFEGTRTVAPGSGNSQARQQSGCQDTENNVADFVTLSPFAPRNTATAAVVCAASGTSLFASMAASPASVPTGGNTLLTVTVIPATTPPSTGITVVGNLTNIGGAAAQAFFDDGTNGDATPGDNVFSFFATIVVSNGNYSVTAVAADAQARQVNLNQNITVADPTPTPTATPTPAPTPTPDPNENPLLFGNPSNATADVANENNYLMVKPQYTLSYSRAKATPNWVAWRLDSSWLGNANRQDDYRPDPALPAAWFHVTDNSYSGSGYDRGHMCPSGDRTRSTADNSATFLMTNFVPQLAANNQGPWNDFENYCRSLAGSGNEIYIVSGPAGNIGTIANGQIVVPQVTWKVVLVLPNGSDDLRRVNRNTRAFGVIVSNQSVTMGNAWRPYRTTVDAIEALTGYNFFSEIPANIQEQLERRRDTQ